MKKLTQDDQAEIVRRSQAGETQQSIADDFEVTQPTVARILKNFRRQNTLIEDPNPALSDEHVQARFWKKHKRLTEVISNRNTILRRDIEAIKKQISESESEAENATTRKLSDVFKARADTYRLELAALQDLSDFDDELTELISDIYTLSQVLCRNRKVGLGTTIARDRRGNTI